MPKRFKSNFLSHNDTGPIPAHSHRHSLVWKFLQACNPTNGETGQVVRKLRDRRDMPNRFPNRTKMMNYLTKSKVDPVTASRVIYHLYDLYQEYCKAVLHPDGTTVSTVTAHDLIKTGFGEDDIALAILDGFCHFDRPAQHLADGGKMADSARNAARMIINMILHPGKSEAA